MHESIREGGQDVVNTASTWFSQGCASKYTYDSIAARAILLIVSSISAVR
jgi:hypothetical protein